MSTLGDCRERPPLSTLRDRRGQGRGGERWGETRRRSLSPCGWASPSPPTTRHRSTPSCGPTLSPPQQLGPLCVGSQNDTLLCDGNAVVSMGLGLWPLPLVGSLGWSKYTQLWSNPPATPANTATMLCDGNAGTCKARPCPHHGDMERGLWAACTENCNRWGVRLHYRIVLERERERVRLQLWMRHFLQWNLDLLYWREVAASDIANHPYCWLKFIQTKAFSQAPAKVLQCTDTCD